jgi:hypothetical protein
LRERSIPTTFTKNNTGHLKWNVKMELKLAFNCYVSGNAYKRIQVTAAISGLPQARREISSTYHMDNYLVIQ